MAGSDYRYRGVWHSSIQGDNMAQKMLNPKSIGKTKFWVCKPSAPLPALPGENDR